MHFLGSMITSARGSWLRQNSAKVFARGLVKKIFERSAYVMRVDNRANAAYAAAWAVQWGT